jgi:hypothetical protein
VRWARWLAGGLFLLVGVAVVGLLLLYALQPSSYRIARTRTITAPASLVMAHLSDVRALEAWDPWTALPGAHVTTTFSPASSGVGAWVERRDDSGGSRTTITALAADRIEMQNTTDGPFGTGASTQTFALSETPSGTEVTWTLASDLHGLARLLWPFVHLEARIAPEMDRALSRLDRACR